MFCVIKKRVEDMSGEDKSLLLILTLIQVSFPVIVSIMCFNIIIKSSILS